MIEHVYRRASEARLVDAVLVATDDERIVRAVEAFGGVACLTRADHRTGTDRLAEVAAFLTCGIVVNIQGDEPLIDPAVIDAVVRPLLDDRAVAIGTACRPCRSAEEFTNPNVVKVVRDARGGALYFSRAPIPCLRAAPGGLPAMARVHVGLYAYRRDALLRLAALPPADAEVVESLEQLRALANGMAIHVVDTNHESIGVDTPDDLARVRLRLLTAVRT